MAAWSTEKATLITLMGTTLSYKLVPENKDVEGNWSLSNKIYSIRMTGLSSHEMQSSEAMDFSHEVIIRVGYVHNDDTQLTTNEGLFLTLIKTLSALTSFENFVSEPKLNPVSNKWSVGELVFHFGIDTN